MMRWLFLSVYGEKSSRNGTHTENVYSKLQRSHTGVNMHTYTHACAFKGKDSMSMLTDNVSIYQI